MTLVCTKAGWQCQAVTFFRVDIYSSLRYMSLTMLASSHIAFKEWAIVVETLAAGEQTVLLRKGGVREDGGQFHVEHREFWLFPTQYHEAERSIIPSKRPALRALAAGAETDFVSISQYATVDTVVPITDPELLARLQGRHIWAEHVLRDRFAFGREPGLHALVVRVYQRPSPVRLPIRATHGGCKSWIELETPLSTAGLAPVLHDTDFAAQRDEIRELLSPHAFAHS